MEKRIKNCGICDSDATCLCFICYDYFCDSCYKFVHEKKKSNHKKEKIDPFVQFDFKCSEHQRGLLDYFYIIKILNFRIMLPILSIWK